MRLSRLFVPFLLAATVATGAACNNNSTDTSSTSTTTTSPSTAFTVTETFSGTLTTNSAQSYSFSASTSGTVYLTLTTLTDAVNSGTTTPPVGISMGTWNGTACAVQTGIFSDEAGAGASIGGTVPSAGTLCVRIYDSRSRVTDPLNYTLTVTHP